MLDGVSVLIIEDQFLIALDIERIVRDAGASDIRSFRDYAEAAKTAAQLSGIQLALISPPARGQTELAFALKLRAGGAALVICSADSDYALGVPGLEDVEVVVKPFTEQELLGAIDRALARTP